MIEFNPVFNFYSDAEKGIYQTVPSGVIGLKQFIKNIKNPPFELIQLFEDIRFVSSKGDLEQKSLLKKQVPFVTTSILCSKRNYNSILSFTGLVPLDFDKLPDHQYSKDFKQFLFDEHDEIIACWISSSGLGVRALLKIPACENVDDFKQYFNGFQQIAYKYNGFDRATQNPVLPLFYSHDPEILYRDNATTWTTKYIAHEPMPKLKPINVYYSDKTKHIVNLVRKKINEITDYGHPPLRAIAFTLGGYVGSGLISSDEAETIIENEIRGHHYLGLRQKVNGYIRTAKEMIQKGISKPISL